MRLLDTVDFLVELVLPDDPGDVLGMARDLISLCNATEHQLAVCAAVIDESGIARDAGSTTSKLLQANGAAPVSVTAEQQVGFERKLLNQAISGAPPAEISAAARALGNELAEDTGGPPPAEDRSLNSLECKVREGRCVGTFDVDVVIGEKLHSALDRRSRARAEPDGPDDPRSATRRRADALHQLLDCGGGGQTLVSAPRAEMNVTVPADHPKASTLPWMGPVTEATAAMSACDSSITAVTLDGQQVPADVSPPKRLFTGLVRKAIIIRDTCCVKCGGHASWSDCHHIVHFVDGGLTTLDNGCLLCRTCHMAVHTTGWDVIMGSDGHPWLIPPVDIDPQRKPLPAYNRRTLTLAA